ncbi:MAG: DUF3826 domain-containing protein [Dysgonomonas sp.]|nr:DUF3826 domain-containing protein [Dysgonomonas sp.]
MKSLLGIILAMCFSLSAFSQDDAEYTKVLTGRADKIVKTLGIDNAEKYNRVTETLVNQYKALGEINDSFDNNVKAAKEKIKDKTKLDEATQTLYNEKMAQLYNAQCAFLGSLSADLTNEQIDQVKDGMTYGVLMVTYKSYCDMVPSLKENEKRQIYAWLVEAREHATSASSSKDKHGWFGKYKGRINNYLSKQGYDIQKERKAWEERVKAAGGTL